MPVKLSIVLIIESAKSINTHAPLLIVRVPLFWYQMQQVCIKWDKSFLIILPFYTVFVRVEFFFSYATYLIYENQPTDKLMLVIQAVNLIICA